MSARDIVDDTKASVVAVPVAVSTTEDQERLLAPTDLPPLRKTTRPISFVPVPKTYVDAQGNADVSTDLGAAIPVPLSTTDARGEVIISTSPSAALVTASAPIIPMSTNTQGGILTSTSHLPAI